MRLTIALYGLVVVVAVGLSGLYALNLAPWYVDFFGPMAPAALAISVLVVGLLIPLGLGARLVWALKTSGYELFVARTIAGLALVTQAAMAIGAVQLMPTTVQQAIDERGPWLADFLQGAELAFEFDGGSDQEALPPKWASEAPEPPPEVGGAPDKEKAELLALLDACATAGGAARYLDDETAAGLGARWLAMGMTQWGDAWSHDQELQRRVDTFMQTWSLPSEPEAWVDPAAFEQQLVPNGRRFLVQVDTLAAELSAAYGDSRAMPPLVPWTDVVHSERRLPLRGDVYWSLHAGSYAEIVAQALDPERDYAMLYDGTDAEAARLYLVHPDPEFDGTHAALMTPFLIAARADRGLRWRSPAYTRQWAEALTHEAAGRAAVRVIFMLSEGEDGDKERRALLTRHHLPRDLDPDALPEDLTPKRGRKVLEGVVATWAADFESVWETAPEAERELSALERKRRADAEALAWVRAVAISGDGDERTLTWTADDTAHEVKASKDGETWRIDWP